MPTVGWPKESRRSPLVFAEAQLARLWEVLSRKNVLVGEAL